MSIILASASPRRKEILEIAGVPFEICPAEDEIVPEGLEPWALVEAIALSKARSVEKKYGADDIVIAADTLVFLGNRQMGKPHDEEEAFQMLKKLSGNTHQVYTGVAVIKGEKSCVFHEKSDVRFAPMTDEEIRRYIATGEPMDKAGAYGVQGKGALFIEGLDGDFFNVMGLPIYKLSIALKDFGVILL